MKPYFPHPLLKWMAGSACAVSFIPRPAQAQARIQAEWTLHRTADGAHPSGVEQEMVWLMNRARTNPVAEGNFLAATGDASTQFAITFFGVDVARMKTEFAAIAPSPPAAFDRRLYQASAAHNDYMITIDTQTHDGQFELVESEGFNYTGIMLSVFANGNTTLHTHATLNIDLGGPAEEGGMQPGRGHRQATMSSNPELPELTNVGLALMPETNAGTGVGPLVFSGAYASVEEDPTDSFNRFIVGTVWTDLNADGRYQTGEGLGGVRVQPDHGPWYAVTGGAGGYAIPITSAGSYTLTFSGGTFPGTHTRVVTVGDISLLVDAETNSLPPGVSVPLTASLTSSSAGGLTLTWSGGNPPYQVQKLDKTTGGWVNAGSPTRELSMALSFEGSSGFFRVAGSP
ncbi:MAG: carboxypeptidase regulatory-like domain-containing protein [Verrucomicrobiaceae bacterium]|nr:MAG: carboxypeptidase regulatory-like domain-containing protein [Verrucomicrobiaceae bacterium]